MPEQNQPINTLPIKIASGITATDYILGIGSAEEYQMLIQDLGDYIIQNALSSLAGQSQTLASAISGLYSKTYSLSGGTELQANTDLNTLLPGNYYAYTTISVMNGPFDRICGIVKVEHTAGTDNDYLRQTYIRYEDNVKYIRIKNVTWRAWEKQPTRAEITDLNNKFLCAGVSGGSSVTISYTTALVIAVFRGVNDVGAIYCVDQWGSVQKIAGVNDSNISITCNSNVVTITNGMEFAVQYVCIKF